MRRALSRAGMAICAAIAFAAVVGSPTSLGEGDRSMADSDYARPLCAGTPCEPGPAGLVDRIDARLARRMPGVDEMDRRLVARTIVTEAQATGLDPVLVLALIEIESAFDSDARSRRGARGLMQLRERTMRREAEGAGLSYYSPDDPIANVQAGVRYLRRLLDAFGKEELALMAYNAGPNRILGYIRDGSIPDRFRAYPRRVNAKVGRLKRIMDVPTLFAEARSPSRRPDAHGASPVLPE